MFKSKYPILAMPLNPLSDGRFAIACAEAGIYPSITLFPFEGNMFDYARLVDELKLFNDAKVGKVMVSMPSRLISDPSLLTLLKAAGIEIIEFILPPQLYQVEPIIDGINAYQSAGIKVFMRSAYYDPNGERRGAWHAFVDGLVLKGKEGNGYKGDQALSELVSLVRKRYDTPIIAAGGIRTKTDVDYFLDAGCIAVGIGGLLTQAEELEISIDLKMELAQRNVYANSGYKRPLKEIIAELV